ncbi:uncharacterized protein LOC125062773 isoform X4 [Pieris napi]|uniref:uncharacterized protein LOC125062773 isoform X4 n=1 Tax=Pieris napi TaxID=78633 RepID=UPI001FBB1AC6|nr:uncharacterized protein LOC125062773 isoform X4 [Pieris napi]
MDSDGMVAVVRGLGNSALTVTLVDGCRQYTLQPEVLATNETRQTSAQCHDAVRSDSCAQATDGRYASTYRMTHCHVNPTSPQIEVTEFPPQRAELCPGQGNFEIGGNGSGEKYHAKKSTTFRGGMSWPDKGSVFASRPSVQPDSFASSLRKYPSMSPERSSEILERLVSFAQNRSGIKSKSSSPTRTVESDSQNISLESRRKQIPDPEVNLRRRTEESPTRDGRREESWRRNTFCRSHDIRYLREVTKAVREGIRSHNYPERLIPKRDSTPERKNAKTRNSVNMEIQAAVQMVSREVITLPTKKPSQRNIAISQTPSMSDDPEVLTLSESSPKPTPIVANYAACVLTAKNKHDIKHTPSDKNIVNSNNPHTNPERRNMLRFIHDIFHDEIKRKLWNEKLLKIIQKLKMPNGETELRKRIYKILNESELTIEEKQFSIDHIIEVMKNLNVPIKRDFQIFHVHVGKSNIKALAESWVTTLPLKDVYLDRKLDKNKIIHHSTKVLLREMDKFNKIPIIALKDNILNALSDIPIKVDFHEKSNFLTQEVNKFIQLIVDSKDDSIDREIFNVSQEKEVVTRNKKILQLIDKEVTDIFDKCNFCKKSQSELLKLKVLDTIENTLNNVNIEKRNLKLNILDILRSDGNMNQREANNYTELIVYRLNTVVNEYSETPKWVRTILRACRSDPILKKNYDLFDDSKLQNSLTELIVKWLESFQLEVPKLKEKEYIIIAAKELSNAVQARCRFLQNHPRRVSPKAETEFLKYLILIWINKMLGHNKAEVLRNANILLNNILQCQHKVLVKIMNANSCSNIVDLKKSLEISDTNALQSYRQASISIVNFAKTTPKSKFIQIEGSSQTFNDLNTNNYLDYYEACVAISIDRKYVYEFMPVQFIYKHYNGVFQNHCQDLLKGLPLTEHLITKLTQNVVNIMWKVYYSLISDPKTNSEHFEIIFERTFVESIKSEVLKLDLKDGWTKTLSAHARTMFQCVCKEQRSCIHRITYLEVMYRDLGITSKDHDILLMNVLDNLILLTKFEKKDPFIAYIYKEKIKDSLTAIINNVKNVTKKPTELDYIHDKVFDIFDRIGLHGESVSYEAQAIITRNQFKDWFKTLPLKCNTNDVLQYKLMTVLAKNIHILSTIADKDMQKEIEKEVIGFLNAEINGTDAYTDFITRNENYTFGVYLPKINGTRKIEHVRFADSCTQSSKSNKKSSILKNSNKFKAQCYCMKDKCKCYDCVKKENDNNRKIRGIPKIEAVAVQVDIPVTKETNTEHLIIPGCSKNI